MPSCKSTSRIVSDTAHELGRVSDQGFENSLARAFGILEFCRRYGVGRTTAYAEIAAGRLRAVKAGKRTLITSDAAEAWLASLPAIDGPLARVRKRGN